MLFNLGKFIVFLFKCCFVGIFWRIGVSEMNGVGVFFLIKMLVLFKVVVIVFESWMIF